ncbi:MAG: sigma-54-dependent Fis family transcriptional regulator [Calditrichaeota bacterium]|nr:sigma-54-dependent Fis family transcriptional regulator [Calditrichota bacterium]
MRFNILILDDEELVCKSLKRLIQDDEKQVFIATNVEAAEAMLRKHPIDLLLLDYKLDGIDGLHVLEDFLEKFPRLMVIMITAYGSVETAVKAMKLGAYDFIQKKEQPAFIRFTIERALDNLRLKKEVEELQAAFQEERQLPQIISACPAMKQVLEMAREFAQTDTTILITGETGTGKNLIAQYIHYNSPRFDKPFVSLNCGAIPAQLMESELFGYEKGAFTGADQKGKIGLLERADGGTLFLDEISELSLDLQTKLLHVLETREFYRVGGLQPIRVDVRFIAATNADLRQRVEAKQFRLDLYYRLNVATLRIPPLRERKEDILPLTKYFIEQFNQKFHKQVTGITEAAEHFLLSAPWQGNVRELRNYIERAMLLKKGTVIDLKDFWGAGAPDDKWTADAGLTLNLIPEPGKNLFHEAQRQLIEKALELVEGNISRAARLLGIPRTTLNYYLQRFRISRSSKVE